MEEWKLMENTISILEVDLSILKTIDTEELKSRIEVILNILNLSYEDLTDKQKYDFMSYLQKIK